MTKNNLAWSRFWNLEFEVEWPLNTSKNINYYCELQFKDYTLIHIYSLALISFKYWSLIMHIVIGLLMSADFLLLQI